VDDEPAAVLLADFNLRAVPVPAGEHEVSIFYRSPAFRSAVWTTLLSLVLVLGIIGAHLTRRARSDIAAERGDAEA
jgi:hypothetical protein